MRVVICLACALLIGCGQPRQRDAASAPAPAASSLSQDDRVAVFEDVWTTIHDDYHDAAFHGVNWQDVHDRYRPQIDAAATDRDLYASLEVMLAELRDAHTLFNHPQGPADAGVQPSGSVGITLGDADGRTVIVSVEPGSDAARAGVAPGMALRTVNGRSIDALDAEIRSHFAGSSTERSMRGVIHGALLYGGFLGPTRTFGVEGVNGAVFDVPVTHFGARPAETPALSTRRTSSGIGDIAFDGWKPPVGEQFASALATLMDAPALVIDLRGNGGGQTEVLLKVASLLVSGETRFGGFTDRRGRVEEIVARGTARPYLGPIVILVDEVSASASEVFAISMQEHGRARIVGRPTCGCVLHQRSKVERGGGTLRWSARAYTSPSGHVVEGVGVTPDEVVKLTIDDLRHGRDAAMAAAERALHRLQPARAG